MFRDIIVFDIESDGKNPTLCSIVELASVTINGRTLKIIPDSIFHIYMKPSGIERDDYLNRVTGYTEQETTQDCINWHAKQLDIDAEQILENWKQNVDEKTGIEQFINHVQKFNWGKKMWTSPLAAGQNIRNFDIPIIQRVCDKYDVKYPFWKRDVVDLMDLSFYWLSHVKDAPKSFSMDNLRDYFGLKGDGAHTAIQDIEDTAQLLIKFLKLHQTLAGKIKFKGACKCP
jgi:DNA polymerase III epsilon subunit-like protein